MDNCCDGWIVSADGSIRGWCQKGKPPPEDSAQIFVDFPDRVAIFAPIPHELSTSCPLRRLMILWTFPLYTVTASSVDERTSPSAWRLPGKLGTHGGTSMTYKLVFAERPAEGGKDSGEHVFLDDLATDYKVYAFYYPEAMPDEPLEDMLRKLGDITGKNLFVNLGQLSDPKHDEIVERFAIRQYPVIIVTAIDALAAPAGEPMSAYVRLDSKHLLASPERTAECVQGVFNLFIQGKVSEAIAQAQWDQRVAVIARLGRVFAGALTGLRDFIAARDISVSVLDGKFELKRSGG